MQANLQKRLRLTRITAVDTFTIPPTIHLVRSVCAGPPYFLLNCLPRQLLNKAINNVTARWKSAIVDFPQIIVFLKKNQLKFNPVKTE